MLEPEILTEIPQNLKRLVRLVTRGFFGMEHAMVIDLLVRNPCMKEDDIIEILKFERKQLRAMINTLKTEKFLRTRMRVETDAEGKSTRHNYYFINYQVFVNVVKYKLDHIRRKIELEERDSTSRASFMCPECKKTFTDLEVNDLFDFMSSKFICTYCQSEVEEDSSATSAQDSRTLLAKFNEQIQPVFDLLRECDDIKLAPELMEPEPTDIRHPSRTHSAKTQRTDTDTWSGDRKRGVNYGLSDTTVTVKVGAEAEENKTEAVKERPVWMVESTVDGMIDESKSVNFGGTAGPSQQERQSKSSVNNEIEKLLFIHESKGGPPMAQVPGQQEESSSSDSEEEAPKPVSAFGVVEEMESDDEEEAVPMVTVGGAKVPLHEVTDEMVARMTPEEKEDYIRLGQEMYQNMYE